VTEVARRVARFIEDEVLLDGGHARLSERSRLDGGLIDSLGIEQLVAFVEEEFGISLGAADIVPKNFRTVGDVERMIDSKLAAGRTS
jgi:acyl carrier protein